MVGFWRFGSPMGKKGVYLGSVLIAQEEYLVPEFPIISPTSDLYGAFPSVANLKAGGFVVTWTGYDDDGNGIFAQRFDSSGNRSGSEFQVNTYNTEGQYHSKITLLEDGGFLIAWLSHSPGQNSNQASIRWQRFSSDGNPSGSEYNVNIPNLITGIAQDMYCSHLSVTQLDDGGFFISWCQFVSGRHVVDIGGLYGQRFDASYQPVGSSFQINDLENYVANTSSTTLENGNIVVVWDYPDSIGTQRHIFGQLLDDNGNKIGSNITFDVRDYDQIKPSVSALEDGGFIVVWQSTNETGEYSVLGQRFDVNGTKVSSEFQILEGNNSSYGTQPSVTGLDDGGFFVSWSFQEDLGNPYSDDVEIHGKRFDSNGNSVALPNHYLDSPVLTIASTLITNEDTESTARPFSTISTGFSATDVDGDNLTYSFSSPSKGTVIDNGNGTYIYTSNANTDGSDSFTVTVDDGTTTTSQTVAVTIRDINSDSLTYSFSSPSKGTVIDNGNGTYTYTPDANENGSDNFTVTVDDGTRTTSQVVAVTINAIDDAPALSTASTLITNEDTTSLAIAFSATDVDGDNLTYSFSTPIKGSVTNNNNGTYIYTPNANENGSDSFTVTVDDGTTTSSQVVAVTINAINDAPEILTKAALINISEDTASSAIAFIATDIDDDNLTYSFSKPTKGTVTNNGNGTYTYTPSANENGSDFFTLTVYDGIINSSQAAVVIINAVNDAPTISTTASLITAEDTATAAIAFSALDIDGDTLTYSFSDPSKGSVTNNGDGTYTYRPNSNENGSDSFNLTVNDGTVNISQLVTVNINAVNDTPTGSIAISGTAREGEQLTASSTLEDEDGLGTLSYQWHRDGSDISGATSATYTLVQDDVGSAISVTASYTDGYNTDESVTSSATSNVINVNDTPTGSITISGTAREDEQLTASSTLEDEDGLGTLSYQWLRDGSDISGATSKTITLSRDDVGSVFSVTVSYTDGYDTIESVTSAVTQAIRFAQEITISHNDSEANSSLYEHQSLVFVSSETEHTTVAMSSGSLGTLSEDLSFTHVELSNSSYDQGISVSDVILQLRDIVGLSTLDGKHKIAADINRDGEIAINDVVSNLRHIVGLDTIEECALVNSADEVVTNLTNSTIADLSIIQYGDVDLSATFLIA